MSDEGRLSYIECWTGAISARLGAVEAKLDQLLALLRTDREAVPAAGTWPPAVGPHAGCKCGMVRYLTSAGDWHCDYCDGVPKPLHWSTVMAAEGLRVMGDPSEAVTLPSTSWRKPINDPNGGR